MAFVPVLFLVRMIYASITGNSEVIKATFHGVLLFFILIHGFSFVLEILLAIPASYLPDFNFKSAQPAGIFDVDIPRWVLYIFECLIALFYWTATIIHILLLVIMSSVAPVVFLVACLLGIGWGIGLFFGLLLLTSSWPIMWHGFEQFTMWANRSMSDPFSRLITEVVVTILKVVGPIGFAFVSMNSGPGKALTSGTKLLVSGFSLGQKGVSFGLNQSKFRNRRSSVNSSDLRSKRATGSTWKRQRKNTSSVHENSHKSGSKTARRADPNTREDKSNGSSSEEEMISNKGSLSVNNRLG